MVERFSAGRPVGAVDQASIQLRLSRQLTRPLLAQTQTQNHPHRSQTSSSNIKHSPHFSCYLKMWVPSETVERAPAPTQLLSEAVRALQVPHVTMSDSIHQRLDQAPWCNPRMWGRHMSLEPQTVADVSGRGQPLLSEPVNQKAWWRSRQIAPTPPKKACGLPSFSTYSFLNHKCWAGMGSG